MVRLQGSVSVRLNVTISVFCTVQGNDDGFENVNCNNESSIDVDADIDSVGNYDNDGDNDKYNNAILEGINFISKISFGTATLRGQMWHLLWQQFLSILHSLFQGRKLNLLTRS